MSWIAKLLGKEPEQTSAGHAKERLQLIIAHEKGSSSKPDFLPELKKEIMAVLAKYVDLKDNAPSVSVESEHNTDLLKIDIIIPQK